MGSLSMKIIFFLLVIPVASQAWTLNNNFGAGFKKNKVKVYIDSSTTCLDNLITVNELESMIAPSVDDFWNKVPTSNLRLEAAGFSGPIQNINNGRLCSPTDDVCITAAIGTNNLIPAVEEIYIACNDNALNFGSRNVLAVTIPVKFAGKKIAGAIILINDAYGNDEFGKLGRKDQIAVIAHEIGHAIGLGHSEDSAALMYYRTVDLRKRLGQDDIDGVSFLYPILIDFFGLAADGAGNGILGGCGTISTKNEKPPGNPPVQMALALGALVIIFELWRLLNRSNTRSTP